MLKEKKQNRKLQRSLRYSGDTGTLFVNMNTWKTLINLSFLPASLCFFFIAKSIRETFTVHSTIDISKRNQQHKAVKGKNRKVEGKEEEGEKEENEEEEEEEKEKDKKKKKKKKKTKKKKKKKVKKKKKKKKKKLKKK